MKLCLRAWKFHHLLQMKLNKMRKKKKKNNIRMREINIRRQLRSRRSMSNRSKNKSKIRSKNLSKSLSLRIKRMLKKPNYSSRMLKKPNNSSRLLRKNSQVQDNNSPHQHSRNNRKKKTLDKKRIRMMVRMVNNQ